ncbi:hypothetical protein C0989_000661 [Termitomyces sp. Mn162]|nr:hypothetical protein C0989_000661 [Termitomyces sp. Mn162]
MLVLQRVPLRPSRPHGLRNLNRLGDTPANRRFFLQNLCNEFLDLAVALPIPPELPAYSTTIILTTIVARFALLPVSIWGKRRAVRMEEQALPELEKMKPLVSKNVFEVMKSKGMRGSKEYLQNYHRERSIEALTVAQLTKIRKDLFKRYRCSPTPSIIVPIIAQLPVFVLGTVMLQRLSLHPTPFDSEAFLTLTTLTHPDPTLTLPIVLGMLTMANVESSNWLMNTAERERVRKIEEQDAKALVEGGKPKIRPKSVIKSGLRVLSVARIAICAMMPGVSDDSLRWLLFFLLPGFQSVAIYWVTSAAFGLLQTWFFDWQDLRRRRRNAVTSKPPPRPLAVKSNVFKKQK